MRKILKCRDGFGLPKLPNINHNPLDNIIKNNNKQLSKIFFNNSNNALKEFGKQKRGLSDFSVGGTPGVSANWLNAVSQGVGLLSDGTSSFMSDKDPGDSNYTGKSAIANTLISTGNPIAAAIGGGIHLQNVLQRALGKEISNINDAQRDAIGLTKGQQISNTMGDYLIGPTGLNLFLPTKVSNAEKSINLDDISSAYTGTINNIDIANSMGGKNYLISRNQINDFINDRNRDNKLLTDISRTSTLRKKNDMSDEYRSMNLKRYSGFAQNGIKLPTKEELAKIYSHKEKPSNDSGSIMIPDGALHAHKHHIEDSNEALAKEITKKGIPVIVTDEKGAVKQIAEIEKEEIILEKSLTEKIESLWKSGKEQDMIECGRLIVKTMFEDSVDNAKLIKNTK